MCIRDRAKGARTRSEIAAKILEYNKAGGKVLAGLTRRRQEERKLFLTPVTIKTGWQQENGGWRFYKDDGSGKYVSDKWQQDGDKWYCCLLYTSERIVFFSDRLLEYMERYLQDRREGAVVLSLSLIHI